MVIRKLFLLLILSLFFFVSFKVSAGELAGARQVKNRL